jgi:hypothetical protein
MTACLSSASVFLTSLRIACRMPSGSVGQASATVASPLSLGSAFVFWPSLVQALVHRLRSRHSQRIDQRENRLPNMLRHVRPNLDQPSQFGIKWGQLCAECAAFCAVFWRNIRFLLVFSSSSNPVLSARSIEFDFSWLDSSRTFATPSRNELDRLLDASYSTFSVDIWCFSSHSTAAPN